MSNDLPAMMRMTAEDIKMMPIASRGVNDSPKTVMPIITAVSGSKAPIMAVGVEPMCFTAITINTNEMTVGTNASINANSHIEGVDKSCKWLPLSKREWVAIVSVQNNRT